MRYVIAVLLALAIVPSSAGAVELVNPDGTRAEPYQTWAERSKMPVPSGRIIVHRDLTLCDYTFEVDACASAAGWIAVPLTQGRWARNLFYHELGHHFEWQAPEWKRRAFGTAAGRWSVEQFAETYAECSQIRRRPGLSSVYNSTRKYRNLCRIIAA